MITVGNYIRFALVCIMVCSIYNQTDAEIGLQVKSMDGTSLQQAGIGQPFLVEVQMTDEHANMRTPALQTADGVSARHSSTHMSSINGKSTVRHRYDMFVDRMGKYTIGPAVVTDYGQRYASNKVTILVGDEQKTTVDAKRKRRGAHEAFLQLAIDNDHLVVGQKAVLILTFYTNDDSVTLKQYNQPDVAQLTVKPLRGPQTGTREKKGKKYRFAEWEFTVTPKQAGSIVIPACRTDYELAVTSGLSGFAFFFGPQVERKRVYSNAVRITVDPLPAHTEPIDAVGQFSNFTAQVKPAVSKEGEAMVLSLALTGQTDFDALAIKTITGMPDALKWYESKQQITDRDDEQQTKEFEFVVQGMREGDWEIPAQIIAYFDVRSHTYKTIQTVPQVVTVLHNPVLARTILSSPGGAVDADAHVDHGPVASINEIDAWYTATQRAPLPWWLFVLFALLPFVFGLSRAILRNVQYYYLQHELVIRKRFAYPWARRLLKRAEKKRDGQAVYHILVQCIASRCMVAHQTVSLPFVREQLQKAGAPEKTLTAWDAFFVELAQQVFGSYKAHEYDGVFFIQAREWLDTLEEFL